MGGRNTFLVCHLFFLWWFCFAGKNFFFLINKHITLFFYFDGFQVLWRCTGLLSPNWKSSPMVSSSTLISSYLTLTLLVFMGFILVESMRYRPNVNFFKLTTSDSSTFIWVKLIFVIHLRYVVIYTCVCMPISLHLLCLYTCLINVSRFIF